jgi:membrane-bound ClpP family serine protease
MTLIVLLFVLGILFLAVEVFVPGGIVGSVGALMLLVGSALSFREFGTAGGLLTLLAAVAVGGLAMFLEFRVLPKTRVGRRMFLDTEIKAVATTVGADAKTLVGQSAEAVTMLSPTGYVRVAGRRYEAYCQSGQVPAGTELKIVGADNFRLIVTRPTTL